MTDEKQENSATAIDALAEVWASIDGKLDKYLIDKGTDGGMVDEHGMPYGYYDGYQVDAQELIVRLEGRGYTVTKTQITQGSGNVFADIGFTQEDFWAKAELCKTLRTCLEKIVKVDDEYEYDGDRVPLIDAVDEARDLLESLNEFTVKAP